MASPNNCACQWQHKGPSLSSSTILDLRRIYGNAMSRHLVAISSPSLSSIMRWNWICIVEDIIPSLSASYAYNKYFISVFPFFLCSFLLWFCYYCCYAYIFLLSSPRCADLCQMSPAMSLPHAVRRCKYASNVLLMWHIKSEFRYMYVCVTLSTPEAPRKG